MGYSVRGLTLYAVLSAIEEDLRNLILAEFKDQDPLKLLGKELYDKSSLRSSRDDAISGDAPELKELIAYIDYSDAFQVLNNRGSALPAPTRQYLRDITPKLESLVPIRNKVSHSRPLDYDDFPTALDVASEICRNTDFPWVELRATLDRLNSEPSFVLGLQVPVADNSGRSVHHNLVNPDFDETGFLGRKQQVKELTQLCSSPYPVITIVGEGGIGKSALALKVAYDILDSATCPFNAIVWTSSKTTTLNATEIVKIENAISDSLGMFQNIAKSLAGRNITEATEEILVV